MPTDPDPVDVAARLVRDRFPDAHAAFLGGSAPTARRTPWSDLDVVVVLDGPPAPFRETSRPDGQLVEWFVHTPDSLRYYWRRDAQRRRTPLIRMVAEGVSLLSRPEPDPAHNHQAEGVPLPSHTEPDPAHAYQAEGVPPPTHNEPDPARVYQAEAAALLAAGPAAPDTVAVDYQRYLVTDLLDDLHGATDPVEAGYLAAALVIAASDLLLLAENRWSARGKWLPRRLAEVMPELPGRLADGQRAVLAAEVEARKSGNRTIGDRGPLDSAVRVVLDHTGGPLQEGFRAVGAIPTPHSQ